MPPVWPVVTFGAKRYPALNQAPTFQESIGPQPPNRRYNSITAAIGLFGPPGMKPVGRLVTEFTAAGAAARQSGAIASSRVPIEIGDDALLRKTMARDHRVMKELASLLHP